MTITLMLKTLPKIISPRAINHFYDLYLFTYLLIMTMIMIIINERLLIQYQYKYNEREYRSYWSFRDDLDCHYPHPWIFGPLCKS